MQRIKRKLLMLITVILCLTSSFACAQAAGQDGLEAVLTTDKASYAIGEKIHATLTIHNGSGKQIENIQADYLLPDLCAAEKGALSASVPSLEDGKSVTLKAVFVVTDGNADELPQTGDDTHLLLWLAIGGMSVFVFLKLDKNGRRRLTALVLCALMIGSLLPCEALAAAAATPAEANTKDIRNFVVSETITIVGREMDLAVQVTYAIQGEELIDAALGKPSGLKAYGVSASKVTLTFSGVSGAAGYEIYRSASKSGTYSKCSTTSATTVSVGVAKQNALNYYKIRAYKTENGKKVYGSYAGPVAVYPLAKVSGVSYTTNSTGTTTLKWNKVTNAQKYVVEYSAEKDGTYTKFTTLTALEKKVTTLLKTRGTLYFRVYAQRQDGTVTSNSEASTVKEVITAQMPKSFRAFGMSNTTIWFNWDASPNVTGYEIHASLEKTGTYSKIKTVTTPGIEITAPKSGQLNYFKVRAYVTKDGKTTYGPFTAPLQVFPLAKPGGFKAELNSSGKWVLSWREVPYADKYMIYYSDAKDGTYTYYTATPRTYKTLDALPEGLDEVYLKMYARRTDNGINSRSNYGKTIMITKVTATPTPTPTATPTPTPAPAEFTYSISAGKATITGYAGSKTDVVVPAKIDGYSVVAIGSNAFANNKTMKSITLPSGVNSIGIGAFMGCTALKSIVIPSGVTKIEEKTFYGCTALESVSVPNGVTIIGKAAFSGCTSLSSMTAR